MRKFLSFTGRVTAIEDFLVDLSGKNTGCYKLMSTIGPDGAVTNFIIAPETYFVDNAMIAPGDMVTFFYDGNAAVPLIYPPQFRAIVAALNTPYRNVKVDYFDNRLISSDDQLKLNLAMCTQMQLTNGQRFTANPGNRELIVLYGPVTFSIPAQTTPYKIIVLCPET